jgi:hypothetical protein
MPAANSVFPPGQNRIFDLVLYVTELDSQHRANNLTAQINGPAALEAREKFLINTLQAFRRVKDLTGSEKSTLRYLGHELRKVRALQRPTILNRILYTPWINDTINKVLNREASYRAHNQWVEVYGQRTALNVNTANLQEEIRQLGFKGQLEEPLKKMMAGNLMEFTIPHYDIHRPDTNYEFHVKRMPGTDAYFLETFVATHRQTKQEIQRREVPETPVTVSLHSGKVFNADEARILAAGKGLAKNTATLKEWYVSAGPGTTRLIHYDLPTELSRLPIAEMVAEPSRSKLIKALAAGEEMKVSLPTAEGQKNEVSVHLNWKEKSHPQLRFITDTGEILETRELQKMMEGKYIPSFYPGTSVDQVPIVEAGPAIRNIATMHEAFTAAKGVPLSPGLEAAAEVHARIQSSKENVGAFVLKPHSY